MDEAPIILVPPWIEWRQLRWPDFVPRPIYLNANISQNEAAALLHRRMQEMRGLQRPEGHRHVECGDRAQLCANVGLDPACQIAGDLGLGGITESAKLLGNRIF
jgi:hypothetical protein